MLVSQLSEGRDELFAIRHRLRQDVVQTALVGRFGAPGGIALSACVYALAHVPLGSPVLVFAALACGLCWGALRAATSSLVPALVAHLLWDVVVLLWLPLVSR